MSNVSLSIGGRSYTVACADGEEGHIAELGRLIDDKARSNAGPAGQSEARTLLFAALLIADEVHELRSRALRSGNGHEPEATLAEQVSRLTERMENLAERLESTGRLT